MSRLQEKYFTLNAKEAVAAGPYDIIVVGTGVGGGTIAADLFDTNFKLGGKRAANILIIEKGDLLFHSHSLNSARPTKVRGRAQDNDSFFQDFRGAYNVKTRDAASPSKDWSGGPMYCLGGRSTAWGLFSPKVHDRTLQKYFPKQVVEEVTQRYYAQAESTMQLSIPATHQRHLRLIERLNIDKSVSGRDVSWEWGRIASQFHHSSNYYFPEGAWSTVDRLLEIAMSKPGGKEHPKFRILLQAEVRKIEISSKTSQSPRATGVTVLATVDGKRQQFTISLRSPDSTQSSDNDYHTYTSAVKPTVVLCAGSVNSAAILMRSGGHIRDDLQKHGCHITDHEIFYISRPFRYKDEAVSREIGGVKLQTYISNLPSNREEIFLANMAIDSSSFLPRGDQIRDNSLPQYVMAIIRLARLDQGNTIELHKDEPVVYMERTDVPKEPRGGVYDDLQHITEAAMATMRDVLDIQWVPSEDFKWERLPLGGVAHELGSIPMPGPDGIGGCVDADLHLRCCEGIRVCDLSVFPVSPEVNPTLTLTALALRLTTSLMPPTGSLTTQRGVACVVNHSGGLIRLEVAQLWHGYPWYRISAMPMDPSWGGVDAGGPRPFFRPGSQQWPIIDSSEPAGTSKLVSQIHASAAESDSQSAWRRNFDTPKDIYLEAGDAFVWFRNPNSIPSEEPSPESVLVWRVIDKVCIGPESYIVTPGGPICAIPPLMIP